MAKIAEFLNQIKSARYGRDVRDSIHDAISAINDESTECWATVEKVPETLAIAAVKDTVSGKDITLEMSSDFVLTDFKAWGNTEQDTTTGKNSFSGTPTESNVYYTLENVRTIYEPWDTYIVSVTGGKSYTVSGLNTTSGSTGFLAFENDTFLTAVSTYRNGTFTVPTNCNKLKYSVRKSDKGTFMLEEGTTATPYEPFTNGASPNPNYPQEIKSVVISEIRSCRKNMLPNNGTSTTENGVSFAVNSDKSVTANGVATEITDFYLYGTSIDKGKYLFIPKGSKAVTNGKITLFAREKTLGALVNITAINNALSKQDCYFYGVCLRVLADTSLSNVTEYPMFVDENETDLTYEPYTESVVTLSEPITLNGIGGVQDYVSVKDNIEHYEIAEIVFDGSDDESWQIKTGENYYQFYIYVPSALNSEQVMCTHFSLIELSERGTKTGFISYPDNTFRFALLPEANITTVDEWKEWLASNPVTVKYRLAEPIETPLPDADVEALKNIRTFKGITHVFTDSEVKPDMEVEYVIDTKMYIDKKIAELA